MCFHTVVQDCPRCHRPNTYNPSKGGMLKVCRYCGFSFASSIPAYPIKPHGAPVPHKKNR